MLRKMAQKYMNHTAFRIADPKRSIEFYEKHFGMTLLKKVEKLGVSNYILGLTGPQSASKNEPFYKRGGLLQLIHSNGTNADNFQANNGNKEPHRGFGHICFSVPNLEKTCEKLESDGVKFQKRLKDGRMKTIAFALDPDNYWIELISTENDEEDSSSGSRLNHSMIRIKDKNISLDFYTNKLGMKLIDTLDFPDAAFTLFFLSFDEEGAEKYGRANVEGLIELTYNYDGEKDEKLKFHNGNEDPVGFSHFGISVDDPTAFVADMKNKNVKVVDDSTKGNTAAITITDPDGYLLQVLPKIDYTISGRI